MRFLKFKIKSRQQLEKILQLRRAYRAARREVARTSKVGAAEIKKLEALLASKG